MAQSTVEHSKIAVIDVPEEAPIRVLHVDDEAGFLKTAKQILEMQGPFQVDTASSVEEANEKVKHKAYDAIVCDYIMPRKDGLQFLKELRDSRNNIPFIIFTGKGREEVAIEALNLGADRYLSKIGGPETVYGELAHGIRKAVERKKAEEELVRLSSAVKMSIDGIVIGDTEAKIMDTNEAILKMYGTEDKRDLIGQNSFDLIAPEDRERAFAGMKETLEKGYTKYREYHIIIKDGRKILVEMNSATMKDADGKPVGFVSIVRDISERKRMEEVLRKSEEQFRSIFESANDCILHLDKSGRILDFNRKALEVFGWSKREVFGKHFARVGAINLRDIPRLITSFANLLEGKEGITNLRVKNKKGHEIPLECSTSILKIDGKPAGVMVIARDITERKKAEERIRASEERYRSLVELAPDSIMTFDLKGVITSCNTVSTRLAGYSKDELVGKYFSKIGVIRTRDIPRYLKMLSSVVRGKLPKPFEVVYRRRDGTARLGEVRLSLMRENDKIVGIQTIMRDVTERKKMLKKFETMNEKLRVVGSLTRHDVRNKLSTVSNNVYLAKQKLIGNPEALKCLSETESAVQQIERIFDFARIYEKLGAEEPVYIDVKKAFEETVRLFSDLKGVKVANDCHGLTVLADSLLRQLFYNLIDNSLKHGEKISQIRVYYEEAGKDQLKLVYEDNGVGIAKAEKEKIFTEGYGKGTGYGLYLMRKMCEVYGWIIRETGKQGKGAQFTITISKIGKNGKENYRLPKKLDS